MVMSTRWVLACPLHHSHSRYTGLSPLFWEFAEERRKGKEKREERGTDENPLKRGSSGSHTSKFIGNRNWTGLAALHWNFYSFRGHHWQWFFIFPGGKVPHWPKYKGNRWKFSVLVHVKIRILQSRVNFINFYSLRWDSDETMDASCWNKRS